MTNRRSGYRRHFTAPILTPVTIHAKWIRAFPCKVQLQWPDGADKPQSVTVRYQNRYSAEGVRTGTLTLRDDNNWSGDVTLCKNSVLTLTEQVPYGFFFGTGAVTGASFMAFTKPEFRFYTAGIDEPTGYGYNQAGVTAMMDGGDTLQARFVKKADGRVLIEVTGVTAENMDKTITVTVTGLGTITFNGNAFAKAMANSSDPVQQKLGAALYNYGAAAKTCFGA